MKHIKKINELIHLDTYNIDSLKRFVGKNISYRNLLNEINSIVDKDDVFFMDTEDFKEWYEEEIKELYPERPPIDSYLFVGIRFLATFPEFTIDAIIVTTPDFTYNFKNDNTFSKFKQFLEKIITHENIHKIQADSKDLKYIPHADVSSFAEYVSHPDELMAWANTIAHEIIEIYPHSMPRDLISAITQTRSGSVVFNTFKDIHDPVRKKFIKYIYQYLDKMYNSTR